VADHPADETAGALVVARVPPERAQEQANVLTKRVELVPKRLARPEQITADFAVDFENEGGFRLLVRLIARQKIGDQFVLLVNRVDRFPQEPSLTAQTPHRPAVGRAVAANGKFSLF